MAKKIEILPDAELMAALPEDEDIRREYDRLMELFKNAKPDALALYRKVISRAAFLSITVDRLERDIAANGYQQEYNNGGGQTGYKKSTAADLLPNYVKLQLAVTKQLREALANPENMGEDELEQWLKRNGDEFDKF